MEQRLPTKLLDGLPDALIVVDQTGVAIFANSAAQELFGANLLGHQFGLPLNDFAVVEIPSQGKLREVELRVADASQWQEGSKAIVLRDVTDRETNKAQLQNKIEELSALGELLLVIPAPVARVNAEGNVLWANQSFVSTFGEIKNLHDISLLALEPDKIALLLAHDGTDIAKFGQIRNQTFQSHIEGALPIVAQAVQLAASSAASRQYEFAVLINSGAESDELLHSYMNLLFFDVGLGLPNLRGLIVQSEPDFSDTNIEQSCMCVLAHGLDSQEQEAICLRLMEQIKKIQAEMLKIADVGVNGEQLNSIRVGRISDDALCLVIGSARNGGMGSDIMMTAISNRLMSEIKESATFGLVIDTRSATSLATAIDHSVIAAQLATENGETVHSFTDDYGLVVKQRKDLAEALRKAVSEKAFSIVFQPRIDIKSGKIASAEVLARWSDPATGPVSPEIFVPILRRLNLLSELTQIVSLQAIEQIKEWKSRGINPITLSINIMPGDLSSAKTLSVLRSLAHEYSGGERLELEMSEMNPFAAETNRGLRALLENLGIELSIDDFGKGYSSFAYLVSLPISCIKVDKSYADDLLNPQRKAPSIALFRSIVALARELKIAVCAEGVETQEQYDALAIVGVDQIQGFYFSKPIDAQTLESKYFVEANKETHV